MTMQALQWYKKFYEEVFAISSYVGEKSGSERFAGAKRTFSIELVIPDGRALQAATSHYLGQNFSKAFNIRYSDKNNTLQYPHQTSWGFSTRAIGGLIMSHGDDNGLILPPRIAPYQVAMITINAKDPATDAKLKAYTKTIEDKLKEAHIRYTIEDDNDKSLGFRLNEAEIRGIPVTLVLGLNEYEEKYVTFSRRDELGKKEKVPLAGLAEFISDVLEDIQGSLLERSEKMKNSLTTCLLYTSRCV